MWKFDFHLVFTRVWHLQCINRAGLFLWCMQPPWWAWVFCSDGRIDTYIYFQCASAALLIVNLMSLRFCHWFEELGEDILRCFSRSTNWGLRQDRVLLQEATPIKFDLLKSYKLYKPYLLSIKSNLNPILSHS